MFLSSLFIFCFLEVYIKFNNFYFLGHVNDPRFATYPVMRNSMIIQPDPSTQQQQQQFQQQQQLQLQHMQQQQQLQLIQQQQLSPQQQQQQQQQLLLLQQQQQIPAQQHQQLTQIQQQQQFRVIYQPMLVRMGPDGTSWQMVEEGAPPGKKFKNSETIPCLKNYQGW